MAIRDPRRFKGKSGGGGGLGILSLFGLGTPVDATANQAVSQEYQPPEYSGPQQYYSPSGEVTNQAFSGKYGFWDRALGRENVAQNLNTELAAKQAQAQQMLPLALQEMKQKAAFEDTRFPTTLAQRGQELQQTQDIERKGALEKSNTLAALQSVEAPVLSNIATMADLPYNLALEPEQGEALINQARAAKQPYVPVNVKGIEGNLNYAENLSQQQARAFAQELANRPEARTVGTSLLKIEPKTAEASLIGTAEPGYQSEPTIGADGKLVWGQRIPPRWIQAPRKVGNIYGGTGSPVSQNIMPSYLRDDNRGVGASQERHEYVTAPGRDGSPPQTITTQGEPPKVEPSVLEERYEGYLPDILRASKGATQEMLRDFTPDLSGLFDWINRQRRAIIRKEPVKK